MSDVLLRPRSRLPGRRTFALFGSLVAVGLTVNGFGAQAPCACPGPAWLDPVALAAVGSSSAPVARGPALRVVSYNLHAGLGPNMTRREPRAAVEENLRAVARAIVEAAPLDAPVDVVGLNEVDFGSTRSGGFDQAAFVADELARRTGFEYTVVRGVTWERTTPGEEVSFGNAALVRHPVLRAEALRFTQPGARPGSAAASLEGAPELPPVRSGGLLSRVLAEERGVVQVTIQHEGREVDLLVTHLEAFAQEEREAQALHLLRRFVVPGRSTVLLGDVNAVPAALTGGRAFFTNDLTHDLLTSGPLSDARLLHAAAHGSLDLTPSATFPADEPIWPLDVALATTDLAPARLEAIGGLASDHQGLFVEYRVLADPAARAVVAARHEAIQRAQLAHLLQCRREPDDATWLDRVVEASGFRELMSRR